MVPKPSKCAPMAQILPSLEKWLHRLSWSCTSQKRRDVTCAYQGLQVEGEHSRLLPMIAGTPNFFAF
jgi:hypothetical protein